MNDGHQQVAVDPEAGRQRAVGRIGLAELRDRGAAFQRKVAEVRTAVLYEKSHSVVQCDYVWKRTDKWINFPWSDKAPVAKRAWSVKDS